MIARWGPPVRGSSTAATKAPSRDTPRREAVAFWVMLGRLFEMLTGIPNENQRPYQKKTLILISPAKMMKTPTAIETYSATYSGTLARPYRRPNPAAR